MREPIFQDSKKRHSAGASDTHRNLRERKRLLLRLLLVLGFLIYIVIQVIVVVYNVSKDNMNEVGINLALSVFRQGQSFIRLNPEFCSGRVPFQWSDAWLTEERIGNNAAEIFTQERLTHLLLGTSHKISNPSNALKTIFSQTLSHPKSDFLNVTNGNIQDDAYRLMFLAIHHHQHKPAQQEAIDRLFCNNSPRSSSSVGNFDYECPGTKYLVVSVPPVGIGFSLLYTAVEVILLAIRTNRVALFINSFNTSSPNVPDSIKKNWNLASCNRRDLQCLFLPVSPCVITRSDLENATHAEVGDIRYLRNFGELNDKYENAKVIIVSENIAKQKKPRGVLERVQEIVSEELSNIPPWSNMPREQFDNILEAIVGDGMNTNVGMLENAALMYILRLNEKYRSKLRTILDTAFPIDFNPESSIGLAIRASDKCLYESECLSFENYTTYAYSVAMRDTQRYLSKNDTAPLKTTNGLIYDTIVLTSESAMIIEARKSYEGPNTTFPFRFIVNENDVLQGTGNPDNYHEMLALNVTADDIMFSSVTTIAFQMMNKVVLGNKCSNFHNMIPGFVNRGCGAAHNSTMEWIQQSEIPEFRLCCYDSPYKECIKRLESGRFGTNFKVGQDVGNPKLKI